MFPLWSQWDGQSKKAKYSRVWAKVIAEEFCIVNNDCLHCMTNFLKLYQGITPVIVSTM